MSYKNWTHLGNNIYKKDGKWYFETNWKSWKLTSKEFHWLTTSSTWPAKSHYQVYTNKPPFFFTCTYGPFNNREMERFPVIDR